MPTADELFRDVPDDIDDSWRHGALVGGMVDLAMNQRGALARSFKRAGDTLLAVSLTTDTAHELVYPVLKFEVVETTKVEVQLGDVREIHVAVLKAPDGKSVLKEIQEYERHSLKQGMSVALEQGARGLSLSAGVVSREIPPLEFRALS